MNRIGKKWQTIFIFALMTGAIVFSASTFVTPKYSSEIDFLLVQDGVVDRDDECLAGESEKYLAKVLSKVVYTKSFLDDIAKRSKDVEKNFSKNIKERKKEWRREIVAFDVKGTGILKVKVYDKNRKMAEKIANGISENLVKNGDKYYGRDNSIKIKVIDGPITSSVPKFPDIKFNTILGFFLGAIGAIFLIYIFEDFDLSLNKKKNESKLATLKKGFEPIQLPTLAESVSPVEAEEQKREQEKIDQLNSVSVSMAEFNQIMRSKEEKGEDQLPLEFMDSQAVEEKEISEVSELDDKSSNSEEKKKKKTEIGIEKTKDDEGERKVDDLELQPVSETVFEKEKPSASNVAHGYAPERDLDKKFGTFPIKKTKDKKQSKTREGDGLPEIFVEEVQGGDESKEDAKKRLNKLLRGDL